MKIAALAITRAGKGLAERIAARLDGCDYCETSDGVIATMQRLWPRYDGFICVMAAGIVVRAIATLCQDKKNDPCVLVTDERGQFVISLLSGHLGGGNALSHTIAAITGGTAVITTASDVTGHTALDLWAARLQLRAQNPALMTRVSAKLVNEGRVGIFIDPDCDCGQLPADFTTVDSADQADIILTYSSSFSSSHPQALTLCPPVLYLGLGCNRGALAADFEQAVAELCSRHHLHRHAIAGLASIDLKKNEAGLLQFASDQTLPLSFYAAVELNQIAGLATSAAVLAATGAHGVAEPAAMLAAGEADAFGKSTVPGKLIVRKMKWKDVTAALAVQHRISLPAATAVKMAREK